MNGKAKKRRSKEFKSRLALEALKGKHSVSDLASIFEVHASQIHAWRQQLEQTVESIFSGSDGAPAGGDKKEIETLERRIRALRLEQDLMRKAVMRLDLHARRNLVDADAGELSVLSQSRLLGLHRSGIYYRGKKASANAEAERAENASVDAEASDPADGAAKETSLGTAKK